MSKKNSTVNLTEAAKILGYSRRNLDRFRKSPTFPIVEDNTRRKGRAVLVSVPRLHEWLVDYEIQRRGLIPDTSEARRKDKLDQEIRKLKMANDTREAQLAPVNDFVALNQAAVDMLSSGFSGEAKRLASGNQVLEQKLRNEYQRVLDTFASQFSSFGQLKVGAVDPF